MLGKAAGEAAIALCADPDAAKVERHGAVHDPGRRRGHVDPARRRSPITQDNLDVVLDAGWIDQGRRSARASRPVRSTACG